MLNLIFTGKHLFAGTKAGGPRLLRLGNKHELPYQGKTMRETLEASLPEWIKIYQTFHEHKTDGMDTIPVGIAFPFRAYLEEEAIHDREEVESLIRQHPELWLLHSDNLGTAYILGTKSARLLQEGTSILVEGIEDFISLGYYQVKESAPDFYNVRMIPQVGPRSTQKELIRSVVHELGRQDLRLGDDLEGELLTQLKENPYDPEPTFLVHRDGNGIHVNSQIGVARSMYEKSMLRHADTLRPYLDNQIIQSRNVRYVFLLGLFLQQPPILDFIRHELGVKRELEILFNKTYHEEIATISSGLIRKMDEIIEEIRRKEAERKRQEEERRRRLEEEANKLKEMLEAEKKALEERNQLFHKIKVECNNLQYLDTYRNIFFRQGRDLGIPEDVVEWHIQNALASIKLESLKHKREQLLQETEASFKNLDETPMNYLYPGQQKESLDKMLEYAEEETDWINEFPDTFPSEEAEESPAEKAPPAISPADEGYPDPKDHPSLFHQENPDNTESLQEIQEQQGAKPENLGNQNMPEVSTEEIRPEWHQPEPPLPTPEEESWHHASNGEAPALEWEEEAAPLLQEQHAFAPHTEPETPIIVEEALPELPEVPTPIHPPSIPYSNGTANGKEETQALHQEKEYPVEPAEPPHSLNGKSDQQARNMIEELEKAPNLINMFEVRGWLKDPEFATMQGTYKGSSDEVVVRLVRRNELEDPDRWENFRKVHGIEEAYFGNVSNIQNAKEGKFYARKYEEMVMLKDYIVKNGIHRKKSYGKLTTKDILFILKVFDAVNELTVPLYHLNEENVLVYTQKKWGLEKDIEIRFRGFTSDEINKEEMFDKVHKMFERHLQPNVYSTFLQKHIIS